MDDVGSRRASQPGLRYSGIQNSFVFGYLKVNCCSSCEMFIMRGLAKGLISGLKFVKRISALFGVHALAARAESQ
jgi:hypothetical protein